MNPCGQASCLDESFHPSGVQSLPAQPEPSVPSVPSVPGNTVSPTIVRVDFDKFHPTTGIRSLMSKPIPSKPFLTSLEKSIGQACFVWEEYSAGGLLRHPDKIGGPAPFRTETCRNTKRWQKQDFEVGVLSSETSDKGLARNMRTIGTSSFP